MAHRIQQTLGLDIGTYSVKYAEVTHTKSETILSQAGFKTVDGNASAAIKELFKSLSLPPKSVRVSLSGSSLLVRRLTLPLMTKAELKGAIRFEAEKHIPFPIDDCVLDTQILSQNAAQKNVNVLLAAAKKEAVQERLKLLADLGLRPEAIDVDILCLFNVFDVFRGTETAAPKLYGLVNLGHQTTSILIIKEGAPFFVREISSAGRQPHERRRCNP